MGYVVSSLQQKPWNRIWDICGCLQQEEVQISLKCHGTRVPRCSVLCWNHRRKVRPVSIKEGSMGKEERVTMSDFSFFFHLSRAFILLPWLQIWFLQMPFSAQLPFTPSHIPAYCSEPPPDSSISLNKTCIIFSPGQLSLSSTFNIILPCSFKSGEWLAFLAIPLLSLG